MNSSTSPAISLRERITAPLTWHIVACAVLVEVVVAGVATSAGVESTARHAHELGFNVALAVDAMTDRSPEAHSNSFARIFPRLGETGSTREIIALLDSDRA